MTFVWGIDVGVSKLAFAFADLELDTINVETLVTKTDATEGERLGLIDRQVRVYARQLQERFRPHVVWVEQPSGRFINLPLYYAAGVVQAALFESLGCPVWTIPSSAWKKLSVGFGNASKSQIVAWCDRLGLEHDGQDEADALAIAFAGRRMVQTLSWEAAA